ncbi:uncharacterized protein EV422DRAFT_313169 [Fimicolochytrium jonesii]|uniref:uncharacterized protein n=1 Tax=Fimicolochytrium jonesii TaxID=1396493 RepID=UPI0022FF2334|nr:uncharacterized protein EV422DRAFT_313169 [Fimicolochytrium jonesii]KAI8824260.1 hypothetical protein EV422DRAFT_313169 [Fimicolochytrium jonesii]
MNTGTEPLYTAEQIRIPPDLPDILKNYTKHIIRTQPGNIMKESFEYFGRLARQKTDTSNLKRLNNMQLEAIYNKFDSPDKAVVSRAELDEACNAFSIPAAQINDIVRLGGWTGDRIPWTKCWALLVASAAGNLTATIETVANILSDNARVRVGPVVEILQYLAEQDRTVDKSQVEQLIRGLMANA